ncbi:MAG: hypothetical protein B6245_14890 [Desulfobacteraceae bacterium 4572_88]|nr:MAG: hypothetical protein B6245_14890 [Desulfobacteraceae bacterium 4572_88]
MKKDTAKTIGLNDHLGCFGDFNLDDPVCRKFCALKLSCVIERDEREQLEFLEDIVSLEGVRFVI